MHEPYRKIRRRLGAARRVEDEWLLNFNPPPDDSDACGINPAACGRFGLARPQAFWVVVDNFL
jgi:hypothetical protein